MSSSIRSGNGARRLLRLLPLLATLAMGFVAAGPAFAQTALADQPVLSSPVIPGNLVMPLSVEYPTGISVAHAGNYDPARSYLGYFDPTKCYSYIYNASEPLRYFQPVGSATNRTCSQRWSGNFLNWATMQTIDPFRWALTGGKRVIDDTTTTVIEKAYASGQGGTDNFPDRAIAGTGVVSGATPLPWAQVWMRNQGLGYALRFTRQDYVIGNQQSGFTAPLYSQTPTAYNPANPPPADSTGVFEVSVRVRVCDPTTVLGVAGVETNCKLYGSNYKPEGLIQQYSDRIRYSVFGYLNDDRNDAFTGPNYTRDAGVLRARQKFVGPQEPRPNQSSITNPRREWDPTTGILYTNGDPARAASETDAADAQATNTQFGISTVTNSGVINYLNKFGQSGTYKGFDPVSELYYAAVRYLKNLGNVSEWSSMAGGDTQRRNLWADGFPVITNWGDPIQYSCQSNFILGIGDVNTHGDKNVAGNGIPTNGEPTKPAGVTADTSVDARVQTNAVGALEGIGNIGDTGGGDIGASNASWLMAGLAYDAHVRDIRPDNQPNGMPGKQTVKTYWVDVLEGSRYHKNNQFYMASKYGGFEVPADFDPASTGPNGPAATLANTASWNANGQTLTVGSATNPNGALPPGISAFNRSYGDTPNRRPDTYFTAATPDTMVDGLTNAFSRISSDLRSATTSFALASAQVTASGNVSYSASYVSGSWTGTVVGSQLDFAADGTATQTQRWSSDDVLATQLAGAGWNSDRRVITYSGTVGIPFRTGSGGISTAREALLDTPYVATVDGAAYLNYLRGERCNELGATTAIYPTCTTAPLGYRARTRLLGDIAGSKVAAVAAPNARYSDALNPGYSAFVAAQSTRPRMVYVGANDGMLHAFNGELTDTAAGQEVFAYVPSALFAGPSNCTTPATCVVDALVSRGNPAFEHRALVDGTPEVFDIDFARTGGATTGTPTPQWRSVLIGGLGKGGRSYYAINVTDPGAATTEAQWASRVLWEFPNAAVTAQVTAAGQMGFTYGRPLVVKTAKHGWVVIFPSGYNSPTGGTTRSYLFFVNPATGALLETVTLGNDTQPSNGLGNVQAYRRDFADNTAESLYAGDLLGNIWRVDVRGTGTYDAPVNFARLTAPDGTTRQPVTTRLLIEIDPVSGRRYVLVGTGSLLSATDIASTVPQSFYAILDGTQRAFASTLPTGFSFPITRDALVNNVSSTLTGAGVTSTAAAPFGWYINLEAGPDGRAWRVILDPATSAGRVGFASLLPDGGACSAQNSTRLYQVDFGRGQSVLVNNTNQTLDYSPLAGIAIDLRYLCRGTSCKLQAGIQSGTGVTGSLPPPVADRPIVPPGLRRTNWRELQIVQ